MATVKRLTEDDYEPTAMKVIKILRDDEFTADGIVWAAGGKTGEDMEWSAAKGAAIVTMKLREVNPKDWQVVDVSTSW